MFTAGFFICLLFAYLIGSTMGAYLVCTAFGLPPPHKAGSLNPGATNVYRLGGLLPAVLTLSWDAGKGMIAVCAGMFAELESHLLGMIALAAVLGHILPIYHKFQGGKGVATMLGTGLVLALWTTLALTVIWWMMMLWRRIASLSSLTAAALAPVMAWQLNPESILFFSVLALILLVAHRNNIVALARGEEQSL